MGYSPWGCKQSGTTEQLSLSLSWELKKQPSSWETIAVSIEHRSMGAGPPAHLPISTLWRPHWGQDDPALPHSKNSRTLRLPLRVLNLFSCLSGSLQGPKGQGR